MTVQLGFADLLAVADNANAQLHFDRATAHLPATMAEAVPFYRQMIERHHAAMLAGEIGEAMSIREEAHSLAAKLNGGMTGIIADDSAPGCVLERETAAPGGCPPLWGQAGSFMVTEGAKRVRIEMKGMFGIGSTFCTFPGFSAHSVDWDSPFLSNTGYRSFIGISGTLVPGLTTEDFIRETIATHIRKELKGRLLRIEDIRRYALAATVPNAGQ
jgi:hypothetical protein